MATVLMVHGTFASGPEEGSAWWQRGSECCKLLGDYVEAEDGPVKVEPVVWDGLNSEKSRQAGGAKLLERMEALDKAGERYCVVGHSHGGSVAAAALIQAANRKRPLEKLSRWITVGTPFITTQRDKFFFSRLGQTGKITILTLMAFFIAVPYLLLRSAPEDGVDRTVMYLIGVWGASLLFPLILAWPFIWWSERNSMPWHKPRTQRIASQAFAAKWLSLRHDDDEAVQSLASLETMKQPIFQSNFAVAGLSKLSILIVPALVFGLVVWSDTRAKSNRTDATPSPAAVADKLTKLNPPAAGAAVATIPAATAPAANAQQDGPWIVLEGIAGVGAILLAIPWAIYKLVRFLAYPTSALLSRGLNKMAWSQLQSASLGNDIEGEVDSHARDRPMWLAEGHPVLPLALRQEITAISDAAAAKAVAKIRSALSELGIMQMEKDGKDTLNAFLTGDELIHTTYFKVPRFRKLLAYAISQSPGFRPTATFAVDPDFTLVKGWYEALVAPPPGNAAAKPAA